MNKITRQSFLASVTAQVSARVNNTFRTTGGRIFAKEALDFKKAATLGATANEILKSLKRSDPGHPIFIHGRASRLSDGSFVADKNGQYWIHYTDSTKKQYINDCLRELGVKRSLGRPRR